MAFITWSDELYSIKVEHIDTQHRHLVSLVNRMHEAVVNGLERSALSQVLEELIDYTVYHFRSEEELFATHHYPQLEIHKQQHNALTEQVLKLQAEFEEGSATISYEVLDFLHDWLTHHMASSDRGFLHYMEERSEASNQ
jgi:hemerythrin